MALTTQQVMARFRVSRQTVERWVAKGYLSAEQDYERGQLYFDEAEINAAAQIEVTHRKEMNEARERLAFLRTLPDLEELL